MNARFVEQITAALAPDRLEAYRQDGASEDLALARYLLNLALCEALYSPLHLAEVALRNALHAALSQRYRAPRWYESNEVPLTAWQQEALTSSRHRWREAPKPPDAVRMVAELNFGFWTGFFNKAHARTGLGFHLAHTIFPHAPREERDLARLDLRWTRLRELRNRVFHHERIVHHSDLAERHREMFLVIGWINPEVRDLTHALDRFTEIRQAGVGPWLAKLVWRSPP